MRTGELYECVESPFSYSRSWGYTPSRILLYDGWLRHRLLNELFRSLKNSAFHRLSRSVNLEYYAFLVFSNLSNRNDSLILILFLYTLKQKGGQQRSRLRRSLPGKSPRSFSGATLLNRRAGNRPTVININ